MLDFTTTWGEEIAQEMANHGDNGELIYCTLTNEEMAQRFEDGFGAIRGKPFTAWTESRVYFPICYDGSEWCGSAPRNPCDKPSDHQGGG